MEYQRQFSFADYVYRISFWEGQFRQLLMCAFIKRKRKNFSIVGIISANEIRTSIFETMTNNNEMKHRRARQKRWQNVFILTAHSLKNSFRHLVKVTLHFRFSVIFAPEAVATAWHSYTQRNEIKMKMRKKFFICQSHKLAFGWCVSTLFTKQASLEVFITRDIRAMKRFWSCARTGCVCFILMTTKDTRVTGNLVNKRSIMR